MYIDSLEVFMRLLLAYLGDGAWICLNLISPGACRHLKDNVWWFLDQASNGDRSGEIILTIFYLVTSDGKASLYCDSVGWIGK